MSTSDKVIYTLFVLVTLTLIGMFVGSWRVILYPYLIVIGIAILLGLMKTIKQNPKMIVVPIVVSAVYLVLYIWLDIMTLNLPTGGVKYVFGLTPSMALYLLGIWPLANIICLLYAWTFTYENKLTE